MADLVIAGVIGGLGNQMFQYALARAQSYRFGMGLRLDVGGFSRYRLHGGYELDRIFVCTPEIASPSEIRALLGWRSCGRVREWLCHPRLARICGRRMVTEPGFHYWPAVRSIGVGAYYCGHWQSERYFADVADIVRSDFSFRQPLSEANADWARRIVGCTAVSLHVRRGDYATDRKTKAVLGTCDPEYYRAAARYIAEHADVPEFFIFSDDMAWVRQHLALGFPCHYIDHNRGSESYNDMRLMSLCRHHIIANSTFSWWGAWLNPHADKIVVAPKRWFVTERMRSDDLIPEGWVRL